MTETGQTGTGQEPGPPRAAAGTGRVVLIGTPSPLRSAVARQLIPGTARLACLDTPARLRAALASAAGGAGDRGTGGTVVFVTVPSPPGLASRLRHTFRAGALAAGFEQAVVTSRDLGVTRVVVLSTAFRYDDDRGLSLHPGSPLVEAAETADAAAAERAAQLFTRLGGDSVVLRLGWTCGGEGITRRVLSAARLGWRLIDGDPGAWVATIAEPDAARAVRAAITAPPGTYDVTDGCPVTQADLNIGLAVSAGRDLHSLGDSRWGYRGVLFGCSRRITGTEFRDVSGWRPEIPSAAGFLARQGARHEGRASIIGTWCD
jgi:hypothetical protein